MGYVILLGGLERGKYLYLHSFMWVFSPLLEHVGLVCRVKFYVESGRVERAGRMVEERRETSHFPGEMT